MKGMKDSRVLRRLGARLGSVWFAGLLATAFFVLSLPASGLAASSLCAIDSAKGDPCAMDGMDGSCCGAASDHAAAPVPATLPPENGPLAKVAGLSLSVALPFLLAFSSDDSRSGGRPVAALAFATRPFHPAFAASDGTAARSLLRSWLI